MCRVDRLGEAGPARTTFEFVCGSEKRFAADQIDVNAIAMIVPVLIPKCALGAVLARNVVLLGSEFLSKCIVRQMGSATLFGVIGIRGHGNFACLLCLIIGSAKVKKTAGKQTQRRRSNPNGRVIPSSPERTRKTRIAVHLL